MKTIKSFLILLILSVGPAVMAAEGTTETHAACERKYVTARALEGVLG